MKKETQTKPTDAQLRASSPENSVWVSANAGSGKTQVLVDRVIKLLLAGAEPSTILCITFTKAAAAEMSLRLFRRLSSWTSLDEPALKATLAELRMPSDTAVLTRARRLFTLALETPGGLKIQTIHGFCERLLHLFPVEAGLAPGFSVIEEDQARNIRDTAIARLLLDPHPQPGVAQALDEAKAMIGDLEGFSELTIRFLRIISKNAAFREGELSRQEFEGELKVLLNLDPLETAQEVRNAAVSIDKELYAHFSSVLEPFGTHRSQDTPRLMKIISQKEECFEELQQLFLTGKLEPFKSMISKGAETKHPGAQSFLLEQQELFYDRFCKFGTLQRIEATGAIYEISNVVQHDIEAQKQRLGLCDFDDLIEKTATLLTGKDATYWVLSKLDRGLNHILVDEAQDTSPAQWQIIRSLADEFFSGAGREQKLLRTMFVVGDRKQSIYSFQGADLRTYSQTRKYLTDRLDQAGKSFTEEKLGLSFRSAQEILDAVDLVFPITDLSHMGIAGPTPEESPHNSARSGVKGIVELWPLVVGEKREKEESEAWEAPVDQLAETHPRRLLAHKIAATLKNWIGRRNLSGEDRPVAAGDILILLQSRTGLFPLLLAEMRRIGLPVAGADRLTLQNSLAVQDLMIFIQWCLLPDDDYALACILKSPLVPVAITEEELFALAQGRGSQSLWSSLCQTTSPNIALLTEYQGKAGSLSASNFLHQILNHSRKKIVERLGSEALEATDALLDLAYDFDASQGGGLTAFLGWFEKNETTLKREMEQASGQIRVMSVHAAKGLEANIVILPDATHVAGGDQQARLLQTAAGSTFPHLPLWNLGGLAKNEELTSWIDADKELAQEERNRLLYVAMTRARNELYITGSSSGRSVPEQCWWTRLELSLGEKFVKEPTLTETANLLSADSASAAPAGFPAWIYEPVASSIQQAKTPITKFEAKNSVAVRRGTALHRLMETLVELEPQARHSTALQRAQGLGLNALDVEKLLTAFDHPELTEFWSARGRSEVEIWSSEAKSQTQIYRIDRMVAGPEETLILDYKSGNPPGQPLPLDHTYVLQLARYGQAVKAVVPEKPVRAALLWLESGRLDWFSDAQLSQSLDWAATLNVNDAS